MSEQVELKGTVVSGSAKASRKMPKYREELREITGLELVPGTLNIRLTRPVRLDPPISWKGWGYPAQLCPALFLGHESFIYRYQGMPPHRIEILTDVHLRTLYGLIDGDEVATQVSREFLAPTTVKDHLAWMLHLTASTMVPTTWRARLRSAQEVLRRT